jgi:dephospho-CoA kinase
VAEFGPQILGPDGAIDRPALARLVFADPPARARLEAIVHPLVRARSAELVAAVPADAVVVNDVPLLVEARLASQFQLVLVVVASPDIRVARLVRDRGMSPAEATARMAAQASDEERAAVADIVLANDGTLEELHHQVDRMWRERLRVLCPKDARGGPDGA